MYQIKYFKWGEYVPLITVTSYVIAQKIVEKKKEQCGGTWTITTINVVNSYEDAMAMIGDYDPYEGKCKNA